MILKVFTQPDCPKCPPAKELVKKLAKEQKKLRVEIFNTGEVEGMAEGAFYQIMATPSLLLIDDQGKLVKDWRGEVPAEKEVVDLAGL